MVGVASSNLVAPTKFGRKNKHLAEMPGAFFSSKMRQYPPSQSRYLKTRPLGLVFYGGSDHDCCAHVKNHAIFHCGIHPLLLCKPSELVSER